MFVALCLKVVQDLLAFSQPQFLRLLLRFLPRYQASRSNHVPLDFNSFSILAGLYDDTPDAPVPLIQGFAIAAIMFLAALTQTAILHQVFAYSYLETCLTPSTVLPTLLRDGHARTRGPCPRPVRQGTCAVV